MSILRLLLGLVLASSAVTAATSGDCKKHLVSAPVAPPVEPRPIVIPTPAPAPAPAPERPLPRREVPVPPADPDTPLKPLHPLDDPKNLPPKAYYEVDKDRLPDFWKDLPDGLKKLFKEELAREKEQLEAELFARYGLFDLAKLNEVADALRAEIEAAEQRCGDEILQVIEEMIERRYGTLSEKLSISISPVMPRIRSQRKDPPQGLFQPLPESWLPGLYYRTEIRNLWLQGEGWIGMREFVFGAASRLDEIESGLAAKYQEFDRVHRYLFINLLPTTLLPLKGKPPNQRYMGRQIVHTEFEIVEKEPQNVIRVKDISGVAVGKNAWAAVHEARKAAAQMATPHEGALRWLLTLPKRKKLNLATNSDWAEIRQGVLGPTVARTLKKRLALLSARPEGISNQQLHYMVEGYFSLAPTDFKTATDTLFGEDFENSPAIQLQTKQILTRLGVLLPADEA